MHPAAALVAALIAAASPSPTPAVASPPETLGGISLGETIGPVLRRLGALLTPGQSSTDSPDKLNSVDISSRGGGEIVLYYDSVIRQVTLIANNKNESNVVDPYGVAFGDSQARVRSLRGAPDATTDSGFWFYIVDHHIRWYYQFLNGAVVEMTLDDLMPQK